MALEKSPVEEEPEVPSIAVINYETVPSEKGYYHGFHLFLNFNKYYGVDMKEDQEDLDPDYDEKDMEDVRLVNAI